MFVYDIIFKEGNPKPKGGVKFQVDQAKKMYSNYQKKLRIFQYDD